MMQEIKQQRRLKWFIVIILVFLPVSLGLFSLGVKKETKRITESKPLTVSQIEPRISPSFAHNSLFDRNLYPGTVPSSTPLTEQELAFPAAKSQALPGNPQEKGTLVVTAEVADVIVSLKPMGDE